jgi:hypothetical protein
MKRSLIRILILIALAAVSLQRTTAQPLDLSLYTTAGAGFYTNTFDSLGYSTNQTLDGTPSGTPGYLGGEWECYINATANYFGQPATGTPSATGPGIMNNWTNPFVGGYFNYASYSSYLSNNPYTVAGTNLYYTNNALAGGTNLYGVILDPTYQTNEPNRCLGIRQVGTANDPGASFVIKLANTLPYYNFKLSFDWMNLDPRSPRTTTWRLQYGVADPVVGVPAAFQDIVVLGNPIVNNPGSNHWRSFHNVTIPNGTINNYDGQVWLRIVTLTTSVGTGNRETFAIDNFGLTWQTGNPGCTPATNAVAVTPPQSPVYSNSTVSFSVSSAGQQPLFYQWLFNGTAIENVFPSQILYGSYRSSILTLQNITPDNQGDYSCIVSNVCNSVVYSNLSPSAFLAVSNVQSANLGYLRTLTDSNNNYSSTASLSTLWQVTGIITTVTNTTSGNTASYYIQDDTGGMNLFVTGGQTFRPQIGDEVTTVGFLSTFQGNLELEADLTGQNNATSVQILSNNIAGYPVAKMLDWATEFGPNVTNRFVEQGSGGVGSKKGSICILPDVYFGTNAGHVITGNYYVYVTSATGVGGWVYFWGGFDQDLVSNTIPSFAYSVQGPMFANIVTGGGSFWSGIGVSKWADVVTTPLIVQASWVQNKPQLTWTAVPQTYSYSVRAATSVTGPYNPIATGLKFPDANGIYTDSSASGSQKFYRVTSP